MDFIPGLELSRTFYDEVVGPILQNAFPDLIYSAALIGRGSEVLGFDDEISCDHDWGPRLLIFLRPEDRKRHAPKIDQRLRELLPTEYRCFPVSFSAPDPQDGGTRQLEPGVAGSVCHAIRILEWSSFLNETLALEVNQVVEPRDWLRFHEQGLLEVTSGEVFHDGLAELESWRSRLAYYPDEIWRFRMAAAWQRIAEEEAFVGRCGHVGDDLGSRVVAGRLAREVMRLGFLQARTYAPYSKWLGSAFTKLPGTEKIAPHLESALAAADWRPRQDALAAAYKELVCRHNELKITATLDPEPRPYFSRPYRVIAAGRVTEALLDTLHGSEICSKGPIGGVDQFADLIDVNPELGRALATVYT